MCFQIRNWAVVEKKTYVSHLVTVYRRNTLSPVSRALLQFYWSLGITWCLSDDVNVLFYVFILQVKLMDSISGINK